jgi:corrinoid protein of di/trimethylamine methyltransferase
MTINPLEQLKNAILNYDEEAAREAARLIIEKDVDVFDAIQKVISPTLREIGDKFERNEIFLPHLMMAANAVDEAIKILEPKLSPEQKELSKKGTVVLGTAHGDIHNIGKNIVGMMLKAAGFKVVDLGVDVTTTEFVKQAQREKADIIAISALMTFTMNEIGTLTEYLKTNNLRDQFKVICGGGALNQEWAKKMATDGFAEDAQKAVKLVESIINSK